MNFQPAELQKNWLTSDFQSAIREAKNSWRLVQELFNVEYPMLGDVVRQIAPDFELETQIRREIEESEISNTFIGKQIAIAFMKCETCNETNGIANPFERLIQIYEHGGCLNKEHGQFIDVFDHHGKRVCGVPVRRA